MVGGAGVGLSAPQPAGDAVFWLESRPLEGGRSVLVRRDASGQVVDVTPAGFNLRTRVHEYGGIPFAILVDHVYFSNFVDQRLYRQVLDGGEPEAITPEPPSPGAHRYADLAFTPDGRQIVCVRERHEPDDVFNEIVALPVDGSSDPRILVQGNDFYAFPRVSPDGQRIAWTTWNHPNMPWDSVELWVAELGTMRDARLVAGGHGESIYQPEWSPEGVLHFISDRERGWWNIWRERDAALENLTPIEAEFGTPQWLLGTSTYAFMDERRIACIYVRDGRSFLAALDTDEGTVHDFDLPFNTYGTWLRADGTKLYLVGASATEPPAAVIFDAADARLELLKQSFELELDTGYLSVPRSIQFPTEDGMAAHALFYAPTNPEHSGPEDQLPPLLVFSHGGPTGRTPPILNLEIQFWTSRGFGVVDVNYRGSTGYGRAYRDALQGNWGVADVDDSVNAARYLAEMGEVDGRRLAIRGGSAGGYTTLCALTFRDVFAAGASYYGIGDLETMTRDTHKFESRYLDGLIGPYPEAIDVYKERSPVNHIDQLSTPVILLQGLEDEVVPPNQAEDMVAALREKGIPFAYVAFEGEQHGFRKAENNQRSLEAELYFYSKILGFDLADEFAPIEIENL